MNGSLLFADDSRMPATVREAIEILQSRQAPVNANVLQACRDLISPPGPRRIETEYEPAPYQVTP